jgi:tetratricopeptide (TPR) repeat protein
LVLGRIDETQQPLVVANLLAALGQTLAGSEMLAANERLITVLRHVDDRVRLARALSNIAERYCWSGFLAKAQDAICEARRILAEQRVLKPSSFELEMTAASLLFASSDLSVARGQFAQAHAYLDEVTPFLEALGIQPELAILPRLRAEIEFVAGDTMSAAMYSEEAVKRANAYPSGVEFLARALCVDAGIRLSMPDTRNGEAAARHAFSVTSPLGDGELLLISHQNLAAAAIHRGCPDIGARLLGSIEAWRETVEYHRNPFEEATYKLLLTSLHAQLGAEAEAHIAQGRQLNLESAAQEVLSIDSGSRAFETDT